MVDSGNGMPPIVDLGAYEKQSNSPAPDIALSGNGQVIANGDTNPIILDNTDFGSAAVSGGAVAHTFTISNSGPASLKLTGSPAVSLTNGAHFSLTQPASTTLTSGQTTTFTLTFEPQSRGTFTATVTIVNNDPDKTPYSFVVSGTGLAADLSLVKSVTPASANPGQTITYTLSFSNAGGVTATGVVITDFVPVSVTVQSVISSGNVAITRTLSTQTAEVSKTSAVSPGVGGVITITAQVSNTLNAGDRFTKSGR